MMKLKLVSNIKMLASFLLASVLLVGCGNYQEFKEDPSTSAFSGITPNSGITFNSLSSEVLTNSCFRCHKGWNYDTMISKKTEIVQAIVTNYMPKDGPLSDSDKNLILSWYAAGAPEGEPIQAPVIPTRPTFESLARTIFANKCLVCHQAGGEAPFALDDRVDLMYYATQGNPFLFDFDFVEDSEFMRRLVIDDPVEAMPPARSNLEKLTDEERAVIAEWIQAGLP
jgi:uncharacterized membrane protein